MGEGLEGDGQFAEVRDEGALVVAEAQVTDHVSTGIGEWPLTDGVVVTGLGGNAMWRNVVGQVRGGSG